MLGRNFVVPSVRILENECFSDQFPVLLQLKLKQFNLIYSSFRDMSFLNNEKRTDGFLVLLKQTLERSNLVEEPETNVAYNKFSDCFISTLNKS